MCDRVQSVVDVGLTASVCTELTTGETWYDAEEDLEPGKAPWLHVRMWFGQVTF